MKVLFLEGLPEPTVRKDRLKNDGYGLGILYLMSYLKHHGHKCDAIFDYPKNYTEYLEVVEKKLIEFQPDYVSITMYSHSRVSGYKCIDLCRERGIKVVVGGHHASALPETLIKQYPEIQVVVGEGERALLDIVEGCPDKIVERPLIEDLDSIPFPDHDFYFNFEPNRTVSAVVSTRGCPYSCTFCSLLNISKRKYRKRSVENVIEEINYLVTKYKVDHIIFNDDAATLDMDHFIALCKAIVANKLVIKYSIQARIKPVSDELLYWMNEAGFHFVGLGIETADPAMLANIQKQITLEDIERYVRLAKKYPKIDVSFFFITGLPGETWDTVENTVRFVKKMQKIKYVFVHDAMLFNVYPGSAVYKGMVKDGKITDDYWLTEKPCPAYTCENDFKTMIAMRRYILYQTSFLRFFTPKGFYYQFFNAPKNILIHMWYNKYMIPWALAGSFQWLFPKTYRVIVSNRFEPRLEE